MENIKKISKEKSTRCGIIKMSPKKHSKLYYSSTRLTL